MIFVHNQDKPSHKLRDLTSKDPFVCQVCIQRGHENPATKAGVIYEHIAIFVGCDDHAAEWLERQHGPKHDQWNLYKGPIGCISLDTVRDIALILKKADPGGCTSSSPEDEYTREAIHVYHKMIEMYFGESLPGKNNEQLRVQRVAAMLYTHFFDSFSGHVDQAHAPSWFNLAKKCIEAEEANKRKYYPSYRT